MKPRLTFDTGVLHGQTYTRRPAVWRAGLHSSDTGVLCEQSHGRLQSPELDRLPARAHMGAGTIVLRAALLVWRYPQPAWRLHQDMRTG